MGHACNSSGACTSATASLVGTATDPEADALTIEWRLVQNPERPLVTATFAPPNALSTQLTLQSGADGALSGAYTIQVCAKDALHDFVCAATTVTVTNQPPVAQPSGPGTVYHEPGAYRAVVALTGSGLDPEFSTTAEAGYLSFTWNAPTAAQDKGDPNAVVTPLTSSQRNPQFTVSRDCGGGCPARPLVGSYVFRLTVRDPSGATHQAPVTVQVENRRPTLATLQASSTLVRAGSQVSLSVTGQDLDGDPLTWRWSLTSPAGATGTLTPTGPGTATLQTDPAVRTGAYGVSVVANDGYENSLPATATIEINDPPLVSASGPATVGHSCNASGSCSATVALTGSATDPEGGLSYTWSLVSPPDGILSNFPLSGSLSSGAPVQTNLVLTAPPGVSLTGAT